jgi:hypothetical protein
MNNTSSLQDTTSLNSIIQVLYGTHSVKDKLPTLEYIIQIGSNSLRVGPDNTVVTEPPLRYQPK